MKRSDFDDLIMGRTVVDCAVCGEPTVWRRPRQKTKGYCPDHSTGGSVDFPTAIGTIIDTFDGVQFDQPAPAYMKRGEYAKWVAVTVTTRRVINGHLVPVDRQAAWALPLDAGPCVGCAAIIRAYGPDGLSLCADCARTRGRHP